METTNTSTELIGRLEQRVSSVIRGKEGAVRLAIATLLSRGHLLIEDVPGVGKTTLAFTLATAIDSSFQRIQFTSDLMPADIIGVSVYNKSTGEFEFRKGPVFANILLADEINRTTPKTQSAMLEAMNERRVTVERRTYQLPEPFMVIATQNPLEYMGTFPLPESQLDRFAMHLSLGYPSEEHEKATLLNTMDFNSIASMGAVVRAEDIVKMQSEVDGVSVENSVLDYMMRIVRSTREHDDIRLGVSTRGAQYFVKAARSLAYISSRGYVIPDDVIEVAPYALGHRLLLKRQGGIADADVLVRKIVRSIPVPV